MRCVRFVSPRLQLVSFGLFLSLDLNREFVHREVRTGDVATSAYFHCMRLKFVRETLWALGSEREPTVSCGKRVPL